MAIEESRPVPKDWVHSAPIHVRHKAPTARMETSRNHQDAALPVEIRALDREPNTDRLSDCGNALTMPRLVAVLPR